MYNPHLMKYIRIVALLVLAFALLAPFDSVAYAQEGDPPPPATETEEPQPESEEPPAEEPEDDPGDEAEPEAEPEESDPEPIEEADDPDPAPTEEPASDGFVVSRGHGPLIGKGLYSGVKNTDYRTN